ncbi:ABC transporter substrate-binding protein [Lacticaseibacillus rhamnosus]|uniref:ABC transporter substrate-binding protein n=1 Tax=Lacticaseibacillus rhamnosus TaxID=47715 RepID=UPI0023E277E4|nr:ABC transporter substrate-binding protein [Lacticaseibacillus rhamnosus]MDF3333217.1 ABC transporter substrate-binding protein [Lacticaseibacillus rhamnosus]
MMKRRWLLSIATGLMALALTACSSGGSSTSKSSKGPVTITFWHRMTGNYNKALESYIKTFNSSQKQYKVVATSQGSYDNLQKKYLASAKSRTLPTIGQVTDTIIPEYVHDGMLVNIDQQVKDQFSSAELKSIYPGIATNLKYHGSYYQIPFATGTRIMFYNKDILDKYHLSVPKTWSELEKIGQQLKGDGITGVAFNKSYDFEFETLAYDAGNRLITPKYQAKIDTPASIKAMTAITSMLQDKTAVTAGLDNYFNVPFVQGKIFAGFGSSATIQQIASTAPKDMHWGTAVMPSFEGKASSVLGNNGISVFKGASAAQVKGAVKFMKFLMSKKIQTQWAKASGYVPVVSTATKSSAYQAYLKANPPYQAAIKAYDDAFSSTPFIGYNTYRNNLLDAVDQTVSKKAAPKTVLTQLQKQAETILKDNR